MYWYWFDGYLSKIENGEYFLFLDCKKHIVCKHIYVGVFGIVFIFVD